jgi:hypothetical protein
MTTIKTTIVIDEETWTEFKKVVSLRYGGLRKLSFAVEEAIKCFNAPELMRSFSSSLGLDSSIHPSSNEIKSRRPKLNISSAEALRKMRDEREARISGFK